MKFDTPPTAVCEISSFQAESLDEFRADALIWTNFTEDHLDRHRSMKNYFAAKWKLVELMKGKGIIIVGKTVAEAAMVYGYELPPDAVVVDRPGMPEIGGANVFQLIPQKELPLDSHMLGTFRI